jgi:cytochrome P450
MVAWLGAADRSAIARLIETLRSEKTAMDVINVDPFSDAVLADPYAWYRRLRDSAPCLYVPSRGLYVVSRYEDVVACARNTAVFSSTGGVGYEWEQRPMMPMYDPPAHTRLRRLVSRPFQPAAIAARARAVEGAVDKLVAEALDRREVDLVTDVAIPLSLGVIGDLLGVPPSSRGELRRWSQGVVEELAGGLDREAHARVEGLRREFLTFLREMIAAREASFDQSGSDVISVLLDAHEDDKLTEKETLAFCVLLLVAGFETTVNAIANGALALMSHPAQWRKLKAEPGLVTTMIEEMIRYDGPVQSFFRNTLTETTIAGQVIPRGVKVMLLFASANRDERRFTNADAFLIDRGEPEHIGYGVGVHYCLGAQLARVQLATLWRAIAQRVARFELCGDVDRTKSVLFRGARHLPIRFDPADTITATRGGSP